VFARLKPGEIRALDESVSAFPVYRRRSGQNPRFWDNFRIAGDPGAIGKRGIICGTARRKLGFLFVGLGAGLVLAVMAVIEFVVWSHHMFIIRISWRPGSVLLAVPFLLILLGLILLRRSKGIQNQT
jgi:hypothetical protein